MAGGEAVKTAEFQTVADVDATPRPQLSVVKSIQLDRSRDALLTEFGKKTLEDRYLLKGESYQDMFARG
jgi:ribonucleoside-diphosphate reductase alpha chain